MFSLSFYFSNIKWFRPSFLRLLSMRTCIPGWQQIHLFKNQSELICPIPKGHLSEHDANMWEVKASREETSPDWAGLPFLALVKGSALSMLEEVAADNLKVLLQTLNKVREIVVGIAIYIAELFYRKRRRLNDPVPHFELRWSYVANCLIIKSVCLQFTCISNDCL